MIVSLFLILYAGFTHAFETDHLLAVSNLVSRRHQLKHAMIDGVFWGLGHSSTILVVGVLMLLFRLQLPAGLFHGFEAAVGVLLIVLAIVRLRKLWVPAPEVHASNQPTGKTAYGIGLVHGLAGGGALVVLVMTQQSTAWAGLFYLLLFGLGSVGGMLLAASLFSVPFTRHLLQQRWIQPALILTSSLLCFVFGIRLLIEQAALLGFTN